MNFIDSQTPIVIAFTRNYFVPVATCILSILECAKNESYHFICLLTEALPDDLQGMMVRLGKDRCRFSFINLAGKLQDIYVDEKYTIAASYRLLLPDLLPEYDKVLYIDCDMIFRNNLAELYRSFDLQDNYLAGVFEATLDFQHKHMQYIGCEPGKYINSGLLLMNLAQLRKDNMVEKFLEAAKAEGLEFPDQDVLNQHCKGKIIGLPPYWNSIRSFLLPQYKTFFLKYYTDQDWRDVQRNGNVHYTGAKPWNSFTVAFDLWWFYYGQLPAEIKSQGQVSTRIQCLSKVYLTVVGRAFISAVRSLYRKIKKNK